MLLQLLGEKLPGQLKRTERWKHKGRCQHLFQALPKAPSVNAGGCSVVSFFGFFLQSSEDKLNHNYIQGEQYLLNKTVAYEIKGLNYIYTCKICLHLKAGWFIKFSALFENVS